MNREIKFRAWDKSEKIMYSSNCINLLIYFNGQLQSSNEYGKLLGTINTPKMKIMQYTGLKDKNGKEIYEADIIKNTQGYLEEVAFVNGSFQTASIKYPNANLHLLDTYSEYIEVIGNIYENPELLEVTE